MPDPQTTEEPQLLRCGDEMHVGSVETETRSVTGKSTSEGIQRCGVGASGCATEANACSGPEAGWSTVLRDCKKNIPLTSFVPYTQRLSMLQDHAASQHPLDILTDPGRKNPNHGNSENLKTPVLPDEAPLDSTNPLPARPLLRTRLSSGSDTVGSRTSSESNLPSVRERISVADVMTPGFDGVSRDCPTKEIHELMSAGFLPKRPLSQICSRTINASNIWKMGSNALSEGLPHYHAPNSACVAAASNPWKSACNISAQIQAARSCSQRVLSPLMRNGMDKRGQSSFSFDVSSAGSSGLCSSASVSSSLEPSPTHMALSVAVGSIPIENGARSRLSSFDRDFHLSSLAARSRSSSFVSSLEEKQAVVIRKLRHELELANEKITSLMTQSNMNVVLATTYEQNVESMSQRNKHLVTLLEEKSREVQKLRSSVIGFGSCDGDLKSIPDSANLQCSRRKSSSVCIFPTDSKATEVSFSRQISSDSLNSESSSCSTVSQPCISNGITPAAKKKSKKNWIKKSLSRAFSGKQKRNPLLSVELDTASVDSSPFHSDPALEEKPSAPVRETDSSDSCNTASRTFHENVIAKLKKQLSERDAELMELKLESLSSVQQMEQLRATIVQLKKEIASQRADQANPKRNLLTPRPSLPTIEKAPPAGNNSVRKTSVASSSGLAVDSTTSPDRSVDFSVDGYPRLTSQESFIFSSPKFLQKFSLKSAITSVSIDDCFLPKNPSKAVTRTGSQRECRKDSNRNHCHVKPRATLSVDLYSQRCDSDFGDGIGRKTSSPLPTPSPSPAQSDSLRRNDANGFSKSGNSTLLQSVI